jgi:glutaminyl-peptide cyclotransferase
MILFSLLALLAQFVQPQQPPTYRYKVVKTFAHDPGAFTQGFEYRDGVFYEGTGLNGQSTLRRVKPETGEVLQRVSIPSQYFGEGITVVKDKIYQLTWKAEMGFIYDKQTLKQVGQFKYPGEGWGFTNDGKFIYMSDGSAQIRVWDAATLKEVRRITVHNGPRQFDQLNELEFINGEIWANVWQTDYILRISPQDGRILGLIDLRGLLDAGQDRADVLNGIAYDPATKRIFVTGKLWPKIYQIELVSNVR